MTISKALAHGLGREDRGIRAQYARLDNEAKLQLEEAYRRHFYACRNNGMEPDPSWLREAVHDAVHVPPGERRDESHVIGDGPEHDPGSHHLSPITNLAVGEMVQTAFAGAGGVGDSGAVIIR